MPPVIDGGDPSGTAASSASSGVLFDLDDLARWLDSDLTTDFAELVRSNVTGLVVAEIGTLPDPVPVGLSALALQIAARLYDNPTGYRSESFAGYAVTYADLGLTAGERRAVRRAAAGTSGLATSVQLGY